MIRVCQSRLLRRYTYNWKESSKASRWLRTFDENFSIRNPLGSKKYSQTSQVLELKILFLCFLIQLTDLLTNIVECNLTNGTLFPFLVVCLFAPRIKIKRRTESQDSSGWRCMLHQSAIIGIFTDSRLNTRPPQEMEKDERKLIQQLHLLTM